MQFRIYIDESGTHSEEWLVIGMLFVPDHGPLHSGLCRVKEDRQYFNRSPKHSARYKETHLAKFKSRFDVEVGRDWINEFIKHNCYFRAIVVDWSIWDGKYFGGAFEAESIKQRRAYKKWAEMLLHQELKLPCGGDQIYHAKLFLDRLRVLNRYDVLVELEERFTRNYHGESPHIESFQHADSWQDAHQCLQLCDLLTGCVYQQLVPAASGEKQEMRAYLEKALGAIGVKNLQPSYWKGYAQTTLTRNFPKFSLWFWRPTEEGKAKKRR